MTTTSINNTFSIFTTLIVIVLLDSCLLGGTHGSIKYYEYKTSKHNLQEAVEKVIKNNRNIQRDTTKNFLIDVTINRSDSIVDNYYNDGNRYVTIYIQTNEGMNEYTFRYGGDKEYWDTSKKAGLSIAYAYDKDGNGGSKGHGGIDNNLKADCLNQLRKSL